jgi:4-nitrophenyl phosphatase
MSLSLRNFDCILLDLDGTIYHETTALPGAVELVNTLNRTGKKYACVSNSTISPRRISQRIADMGASIDPQLIYTASVATCDIVIERFARNRPATYLNLATDAIDELFGDFYPGRAVSIHTQDEPCDAVIVGAPVSENWTFERQTIGLRQIKQGATLFGICADRMYPSVRGLELGAGSSTAMLAYAANVTPIYCGKPERIFFDELLARIGAKPSQCVMIGDNLEADIAGANAMGMTTVLTLTGIVKREEATAARPESRPHHIIADLTELVLD